MDRFLILLNSKVKKKYEPMRVLVHLKVTW